MKIKLSIVFILLVLGIACQVQKAQEVQEAPWLNLSWLERASVKVIVNNKLERSKIKLSYFNKSTREKLEQEITLEKGQQDTTIFKLFRPELVTITSGSKEFNIYLLPNKNMEIEIGETVQFTGINKGLYETLYEVGDHKVSDEEFENIQNLNSNPIWLKNFLSKSRELKELYTKYHQYSYQQFTGLRGIKVALKDSIRSSELLNDYKDGQYHNYYSTLQLFKYNFEFVNKNDSMPVELENYAKRKNLFDKILSIEDERARNSLLTIQLEGSTIRKRKSFKLKDEILAYTIGHLPEEYVLKLNEIEKEYSDQNYDQKEIVKILNEKLESLNGEEQPLNENSKRYKLLKFWFSGCAPCKKQIPYENALLEQNEKLDIMHFCYSTSKEKWKEYISKNEPKGIHYFLKKEDYKKFKNVFKLGYAPRYILLNQSNEVICWECSNPSNKEFEKKLSD